MIRAASRSRRRLLQAGLAGATGFLVDSPSANTEKSAPSRQLYLAIYGPGPNWIQGRPTSEQPLREHGRHMLDLHRQGRLRLAGSFADDPGGAAAFEADDDDAARTIVSTDPAIITGVMVCSLRRWKVVDWEAVRRRAEAKA
jgi:uncharacterized protein YciI